MKVILTKDVPKLGEAGIIIKVADGFARNYLIPKDLAIPATKTNLSRMDSIKKAAEAEKLALESKYHEFVQQLAAVELVFQRRADENDHLFGSVSDSDISKTLEKMDIPVHKSFIKMEKHLKEIGEFEVQVVFTPSIHTTLKVKVEKE